MRQALVAAALEAGAFPSCRDGLVVGPDRVLALFIADDVETRVGMVPAHGNAPSGGVERHRVAGGAGRSDGVANIRGNS
ncbi:hypothetical protein D3C72_2072280 [compost metagenome]